MGCCPSTKDDYHGTDIEMQKKFDTVKLGIDKVTRYLKDCDSYATEETTSQLEALIQFASIKFKFRKEAAYHLAQSGYGKLYVKMTDSLHEYRRGQEGESQGAYNLMIIQKAFWNFSDVCPYLGRDLGKYGGVDMLLNDLDVLEEYQGKHEVTEYIEILLGILHNAIRLYSNNRPIYREANAVYILTKLLKSKDVTVKMKALLVLAYCVDEKESELLATAHGCVTFLTDMLKQAVEAADHKAVSGMSRFSAEELLSGLNQLAVNDANKCEIEREDGIGAIGRMLQPDFSEEEKRLAAEALWNLSFVESIRTNIRSTLCTSVLQGFSTSENEELREVSTFALWEMEGGKMDLLETPTQRPEPSSQEDLEVKQHIMISYQWDAQQLALNVKEKLVIAGYKVWMDVDKMKGDILSAMAEAIERSAVVVICMSQKYKASLNCRSEASYAYKKKKPIIPLLVEDGYEPDGWLGVLIGMQLYYEAFSKVLLDMKMPALLGEIKERGYGNTGAVIEAVNSSTTKALQESRSQGKPSPSSYNETQDTVREWSKDQVQKWFEEKDLVELCSVLHFCDGKHLVTMYNRHNISPESFQMDLKSDLNLDFNTRLKFSTALDGLLKHE